MPDIVDIAEEEKKHTDEWLLFEVTEVTEQNLPVKGRLLCHSRSRQEIHEVAMRHPDSDLKTTFVGRREPPNTMVALWV